MVCPPKQTKSSRDEKPVFHVYTSQENEENVGSDLILEVCRNLTLERKEVIHNTELCFETRENIAIEKINREGITKNWRTGEDM